MSDNELLTLRQAAALLQVSTRTLRRRVKDGSMRAYTVAGTTGWRFRKSELLAALRPVPAGEEGER